MFIVIVPYQDGDGCELAQAFISEQTSQSRAAEEGRAIASLINEHEGFSAGSRYIYGHDLHLPTFSDALVSWQPEPEQDEEEEGG